jgi:asparaginyl-tRNA synthetase
MADPARVGAAGDRAGVGAAGDRAGPAAAAPRVEAGLFDPAGPARLVAACYADIARCTHRYWEARGVRPALVPVTTVSVSSPMGLGSDSSPVPVHLAGRPAFLADSQQFALELLCRLYPYGAYYLMSSLRGEPSDATHLAEFFHSEVELPTDLPGLLALAEGYLAALAGYLIEQSGDELSRRAGGLAHLRRLAGGPPPRRLTLAECLSLVGDSPALAADGGGDRVLTRRGELEVAARVGPVWVVGPPHRSVPFYQAFDPADGSLAVAADLLLPGVGEVLGAGQRHAEAGDLLAALELHGVPVQPYRWYVDLRTSAPMVTSGFGLGVERFLMWVLDEPDIRRIPLFLRTNPAGYEF